MIFLLQNVKTERRLNDMKLVYVTMILNKKSNMRLKLLDLDNMTLFRQRFKSAVFCWPPFPHKYEDQVFTFKSK